MPSMAHAPGAVGGDEENSSRELRPHHSLSLSYSGEEDEDDVETKWNEFAVVPTRRVVSHPIVPSKPLIRTADSSEDELTMEKDLILTDLDEDEDEEDLLQIRYDGDGLEGAASLKRGRRRRRQGDAAVDASIPQQDLLDRSAMAPIPMRRVLSHPTHKTRSPNADPAVDASSPQQDPLDMSALAPIPMRRVLSNPTRKAKPPLPPNACQGNPGEKRPSSGKKATPVRSGDNIVPAKESVASGSKWQLTKPYAMRRQWSQPLTSGERSSVAPLLHLSRTYSSSSLSSTASSLAEEEMAELAAQLATPNPPQRNLSLFRSNQNGSPSLLLRSGSNRGKVQVIRRSLTDTPTVDESRDERSTTFSPNSFDVSDAATVAGVVAATQSGASTRRRLSHFGDERHPSSESSGSSQGKIPASILQRNSFQFTLYLSTFAIFGFIVRVYVSRFFGFDCEFPDAVNDFLTPLSRKICVTATGRTFQTGGALFIELPANMLGSFVMGVMTSLAPDIWPPLPWLREDHPLQRHGALHVAIKTGFCGSLTSFASWNTQMIVMLDGTATELGSQIVPALFGYVLGLFCALASFIFGGQVSTWLNQWKNPDVARYGDGALQDGGVNAMEEGRDRDTDIENTGRSTPQVSSHPTQAKVVGNLRPPPSRIVAYPTLGISYDGFCHRMRSIFNGRRLPFVVLAGILALFVVADVVWHNSFYRGMWLATLFTPPGVLLRWQLAKWNHNWSTHRFNWVPWGTFAANVLGSVVSVLLVAIETRYFGVEENNPWTVAVLVALRGGFAGSLSTVSSLVKELADLTTSFPNQAKHMHYACGTILTSAVLCIALYIPMV